MVIDLRKVRGRIGNSLDWYSPNPTSADTKTRMDKRLDNFINSWSIFLNLSFSLVLSHARMRLTNFWFRIMKLKYLKTSIDQKPNDKWFCSIDVRIFEKFSSTRCNNMTAKMYSSKVWSCFLAKLYCLQCIDIYLKNCTLLISMYLSIIITSDNLNVGHDYLLL